MEKAGEILKTFLKGQNVAQGEPYVHLFQGWGELVGTPLRDHSRALDIKNQILSVEVDHPGWMQMLHFRQSYILKQVRRRYPQLGIRGISIRVVLRQEQSEQKPPVAEKPAQIPQQDTANIHSIVSSIHEDELRNLLSRLFSRVLERNTRKPE